MKMPQIVTVVFVLMLLFGWAVYQGVQQLHRSVTHSDAPDTYTSKIDDVRGGGQIITVTEKGKEPKRFYIYPVASGIGMARFD
jgi:hypothetical protein